MRLTLAALLLTAACATVPPPLCDREAQEWNKFDTAEDVCATGGYAYGPAHFPIPVHPHRPAERVGDDPDEPDDQGDTGGGSDGDASGDTDAGADGHRVKGNNGWGNGDQDAPGGSGPNNNAENNHTGKERP